METQESPILTRLLELIDRSPGFAGLGASIQLISKLNDEDDGGRKEIATAILRDAALTAKLLRLSNSSRNARGGRSVSTIDQAIAILGINTVKSVALSLALLDTLSHKPQSNKLHAEIVAAYFCGSLAAEVTRQNGGYFSAQESQVCGLMQNLGRMMVLYHLYDEIERSRALQVENNFTEEEAIEHTLGASFEAIGAGVARHWQLPDVLQQSLALTLDKVTSGDAGNASGWHQLCSLFARRITDTLFRLPENREKFELKKEIEFFRESLRLKEADVLEWIEKSLGSTDQLLAEINFPCNVGQARVLLRKSSERVLDRLSQHDSLNKEGSGSEGKTALEIIQQVLVLLHDKFGFDRTLLCLPDGSSGLTAIAGVGPNVGQITTRFRCRGAKLDIFRLVLNKQVDMYIADAHSPSFSTYIPSWYPEVVGARSFMLLSLIKDGRSLGLLYGDYTEHHPEAPPNISSDDQVKGWREQLQAVLNMATSQELVQAQK